MHLLGIAAIGLLLVIIFGVRAVRATLLLLAGVFILVVGVFAVGNFLMVKNPDAIRPVATATPGSHHPTAKECAGPTPPDIKSDEEKRIMWTIDCLAPAEERR